MPPQIQLVRGNRAPRPKRPFVELCARSAFSFLGGASLPEDLIDRAAELELPAIALVDRAGVYGAPRFYQAARAAGVRAIVGAGVPLEPWSSSGAHPSPRPSPHPGRGSLLPSSHEPGRSGRRWGPTSESLLATPPKGGPFHSTRAAAAWPRRPDPRCGGPRGHRAQPRPPRGPPRQRSRRARWRAPAREASAGVRAPSGARAAR